MRRILIGLILVFLLITTWSLYSFYKTADTFEISQPQVIPHASELLKETPQTSTDNLSDWLTYRSEELGFEFKYPKDMEVTYEIVDTYVSESSYNDCVLPYARVSIGYNLEIQNDVCKIPDFKRLESESELMNSLIKVKYQTYTGQMGDDEWRLHYYYFNLNDSNWRAQITGEPFNTYERILRTIKSIDTSKEKTYRNDKYKFSFEYPSDYTLKETTQNDPKYKWAFSTIEVIHPGSINGFGEDIKVLEIRINDTTYSSSTLNRFLDVQKQSVYPYRVANKSVYFYEPRKLGNIDGYGFSWAYDAGENGEGFEFLSGTSVVSVQLNRYIERKEFDLKEPVYVYGNEARVDIDAYNKVLNSFKRN